MVAAPLLNDLGILIDAYVDVRGPLVSKNGTRTQERLDVYGMGWEKIDDLLETLSFAARVSHRSIIVISGDEVKRNIRSRWGSLSKRQDGRLSRETLTKIEEHRSPARSSTVAESGSGSGR